MQKAFEIVKLHEYVSLNPVTNSSVYNASNQFTYNFAGDQSCWFVNRPFSYSRYWTGTSLQLRLMRGVFSDTNDFYLFLMIFSRQYENGLLH